MAEVPIPIVGKQGNFLRELRQFQTAGPDTALKIECHTGYGREQIGIHKRNEQLRVQLGQRCGGNDPIVRAVLVAASDPLVAP